jgi:mannose-6-phosphate isomerase-like protein (cupin superfamily)|tara:strand:- start:1560 stop:2102 length:543 start_codon:yes stop_codon:yes gene_type:complete
MSKPTRRIVTGHDKAGKGIIISDSHAKNIMKKSSRPGVSLTNIWQTNEFPNKPSNSKDADREFIMFPESKGTVLRVSEFEPEEDGKQAIDGKSYFADLGVGETSIVSDRHPFMHRSETIDYAIVLEGEITLLLDDNEVDLKAGDIVVQQGTSHAWVNKGDKICRVAFILMGAIIETISDN